MKCFVTGATGFIGSYVVKSLVEAGNEVIALYHSSAASRWLDGMLTEEERERLKFVQGDMTDSEMIKRLIVDHGTSGIQVKSENESKSNWCSTYKYCSISGTTGNLPERAN